MTEKLRQIVATLITPSVFAALLSSGFTGYIYLYSFVIVYLAISILTLPIYIHLNRIKGLKIIPIIFGTFVVGIVAGMVLVLFNFAEGISYDHTRALEGATPTPAGTGYEFINIMFTGLLGASVGFIWWVMPGLVLIHLRNVVKAFERFTYNKRQHAIRCKVFFVP